MGCAESKATSTSPQQAPLEKRELQPCNDDHTDGNVTSTINEIEPAGCCAEEEVDQEEEDGQAEEEMRGREAETEVDRSTIAATPANSPKHEQGSQSQMRDDNNIENNKTDEDISAAKDREEAAVQGSAGNLKADGEQANNEGE